jgi:hypothetical protein
MNLDTRVKIKNKWIEISNHRALVPNVQGETGLVFKPETIKKSVGEYLKLIEQAPYYRVLLDSHVEMSNAKWADIAGMLTDLWIDNEGAARINYVVFNNTPVFDRMMTMAQVGGIGFASLSTRGYGKHVEIRPSRIVRSNAVKKIRMLHDSPIKYFKVLGESKYKKGGIYLEDFILLGWDIVVAPSQNDASSLIFLEKADPSTLMVEESGGIIRKAFGDRRIIKESIVKEMQMCTGTQCYAPVTEACASLSLEYSNTVPPLRTYLTSDGNLLDEIHTRLGTSISGMLKQWA